ncbi:branched-chain amino acid ABC transporter permease [Chelatococcus reniformis]|nr:branched-chain amino acid ABC transporter permease [Chelatococcus reniformis]
MRNMLRTIAFTDWLSIAILLAFAIVPFLTGDFFTLSLTNQILIAVTAALSVHIMLRMDLLSFAVPAFMAIGGYAAAMTAQAGATNLVVLLAVSFASAAIVALPLGALVLRLRGVYFVLVTFIFTEILQLLIFETPGLTGGSNGIPRIPAPTLGPLVLNTNHLIVLVSICVAVIATVVTMGLTRRYGQEFASIEENETLAQSLGLVAWHYRTIGFVVAGGIAGMAGFALVNLLLTAHPTSFTSMSSVFYIAYVLIGGRRTILGAVVGSCLLVWATKVFSSHGEYSAGFFGLLLIIVVTAAPNGLVGLAQHLLGRVKPRSASPRPEVADAHV